MAGVLAASRRISEPSRSAHVDVIALGCNSHFRSMPMSKDSYRPTRPITDHLHPGVYVALVFLALWFVVSAWGFGGDGHTDYLLVVASGLILFAVAIPITLWRIWRSHPHEEAPPTRSLREWASTREFRTWQDRVKAKNAAIEILLPIAAVAFGMSIFAIIVHFTAR
jgi:hypothetical protein